MQLTLFYYPRSASLAPRFLLHHIKADYQLELVDKKSNNQKSAQYLRLNPAGRIPTLIADQQPIFESAAICIYLAELYPQYQLIPPLGDKSRPLFFQWITYLTNTLQNELMMRFYPQRHTIDDSQVTDIIEAQEARLRDIWVLIDHHLADNAHLNGEQLSACDYYLFMLAIWATDLRYSPLHFPHLSQYLHRLSHNVTIEAVCQLEAIDLTPFRVGLSCIK